VPLLLAFDASWCGQTRLGGWAVVGQARGGAAWTDSGFLGRCADPTAAEARALAEALRLIEEQEDAVQAAVLLTDCRSLLDLVARAEPRPRIPDSDRILAAFDRRPGIHLAYLHRRCRRMRLAHHLANVRRLEAELSAHRPRRQSRPQESQPC